MAMPGGSDERKRLGHHMVVSNFMALLKDFWLSIIIFMQWRFAQMKEDKVEVGARPCESEITVIVLNTVAIKLQRSQEVK